jgi:hypothetical protein
MGILGRRSRWVAGVGTMIAAASLVQVGAARSADCALGQPPQPAATGSLPSVASGARPGPDVLYAPPPAAPQLENRAAEFKAAPLLVSGRDAHLGGEYLYQDFLYDDLGSDTDSEGIWEDVGDITYPTNTARYGGNAADLVEVRVSPQAGYVAYRFTLNTLLEPDTTMIVTAFDTDRDATTGSATLPRDPRARFPGTDEVLYTWGTGAEHVNLTTGTATPLAATADLEANQITVRVPRSASNPRTPWKATVGAGLYNPATGGFLYPGSTANATTPGGSGWSDSTPTALFNVARTNEVNIYEAGAVDRAQAVNLRQKEPTRHALTIDFAALDARADSTTVPDTGIQVRIFPSRLQLGEGKAATAPIFRGQLQPYSLTIPSTYEPGQPAGLVLALHSLSRHHSQYNGTEGTRQVGEERGAFVLGVEGRGVDGWYTREAEYDVFEAWNDAARHFTLDSSSATIQGYSMGGFGSFKLGGRWPDLFSRLAPMMALPGNGYKFPYYPPPGYNDSTDDYMENDRNVPVMYIVGAADEAAWYPLAANHAYGPVKSYDSLNYRFSFITLASDHFIHGADYNLPPLRDFLGDGKIDRNPRHVTFSHVPAADVPELGLVADHGYWVSNVQLAQADRVPNWEGGVLSGKPVDPSRPKGTVDAFSHAYGLGDPPGKRDAGAGVATLPYTEVKRTWLDAPTIPAENKLTIKLDNVSKAAFDLARAGLDTGCSVTVEIDSTDGATLELARPEGLVSLAVPPGRSTHVVPPAG